MHYSKKFISKILFKIWPNLAWIPLHTSHIKPNWDPSLSSGSPKDLNLLPSPQQCSADPISPSLRIQPQDIGSNELVHKPHLYSGLTSPPRDHPGQNDFEDTLQEHHQIPPLSRALRLFHLSKTWLQFGEIIGLELWKWDWFKFLLCI